MYRSDRLGLGEACVDLLRDQLLTPVRSDPHDAAAGVRRPERPVGLRQDALRPLQIAADKRDLVRIDRPAAEQFRAHVADR